MSHTVPSNSYPKNNCAQPAGVPSFTQNHSVQSPCLSLTAMSSPPLARLGNPGPLSETLIASGVKGEGELRGPMSFGIRNTCADFLDSNTPPLSSDEIPNTPGPR